MGLVLVNRVSHRTALGRRGKFCNAQWRHSFTRLFAMIRGVVWDRLHLPALLEFNGTARERWRMRARPEGAFLPGIAPTAMGQHTC